MRTVLGMIAGFGIFAVSVVGLFAVSGREPYAGATTGFMVLGTLYGMLFAFLAGWVAGAVARRHDRLASTVVAVLIAVIAGVSWAGARETFSVWSLSTILLIAPSVLAGGALHHRRAT